MVDGAQDRDDAAAYGRGTRSPAQPATPVRAPGLWRRADYRWWLTTDTSTAFGRALLGLAVPLLALYVTGSPGQAGVVGAVGATGRVLATIPGGVLTDRHDRRRLILLGATLGTLLAVALAAVQLAGVLDFWLLVALNLLMNVRSGLFDAVPNAALPAVVESERRGSAVAANQGRDAVVSLAGGPVGGVLMGIGHVVPFLGTAVLHVLSAVAALRIRADLRPAPEDGGGPGAGAPTEATGLLREAWAGFAWLAHRPELRGLMAVSTILNLGINAAITAVVFGLQQRGEAPSAIGLVSASVGLGLLAGSLVATVLVQRVPTGLLSGVGLLTMAGATAFLPVAGSLPAVCAVLAVSMAAAPVINAGLLGYLLVAVPSRLLGRASSALDVLALGAVPLAPLLAGFSYTAWGWSGVLGACAGLCGVAAVLAITHRGLRSLPVAARWPDHAARSDRR
ncbi:MFS transporter [Tersicoccus solisilvae]|uniref:MFS transporter n=2 Tax=Tersicoccus solisilvae TaxID=1882339 RepID=A0ABQ1P3T2_9MICC|nr:MFS transporter [Tersicoccus solisilvae]